MHLCQSAWSRCRISSQMRNRTSTELNVYKNLPRFIQKQQKRLWQSDVFWFWNFRLDVLRRTSFRCTFPISCQTSSKIRRRFKLSTRNQYQRGLKNDVQDFTYYTQTLFWCRRISCGSYYITLEHIAPKRWTLRFRSRVIRTESNKWVPLRLLSLQGPNKAEAVVPSV